MALDETMTDEDLTGYGTPVPAPQAAPEDPTVAYAYAPPSHFEGEPAIPIPNQPPGPEIAPNQAVTLPSGVVAYRETASHRQKLVEYERQQEAARVAAQQAAMDAQMFQQMSRVAGSLKDIEVARRNIDAMQLTRELQNTPPDQHHQVLMRHPLALGAGYGSALHYTAPVAQPTIVPPSGTTPGYIQDPRGVPHFFPGSGQAPAHKLGEVIAVTDPATGVGLGHVIATGPNTGRFEKAEGVNLTPSNQIAILNARIRVTQAQLSNDVSINDTKEREKAIAEHTAQLATLGKELMEMPKNIGIPKGVVPPPSTAKVAVLGQGTRTDPARPVSKEQFDSMPSGSFFINPSDGKLRQKK